MQKETKELQENVFLFWKNISETTYQATLRFKIENPDHADDKMCFAGRLDPMAQGWLVFLLNDAVFLKDDFIKKDKIYSASILIGITTDTDDVFGLIDENNLKETTYESALKTRDLVIKEGGKFVKIFKQQFSPFSSKHIDGKPLFWWATEKRLHEIEMPTHEVTVKSFEVSPHIHICDKDSWLKEMVERFSSIEGNFRNQEIIEQWGRVTTDYKDQNFFHLTVRIHASTGMYVRQLMHDIADTIGIPLTVVEITREEVIIIDSVLQ